MSTRCSEAALLVLASDLDFVRKPGRVLDAWDLVSEPDFSDVDGQRPPSETLRGLE